MLKSYTLKMEILTAVRFMTSFFIGQKPQQKFKRPRRKQMNAAKFEY